MPTEEENPIGIKLPLVYRIIRKLPLPSPSFLPPSFNGVFWAVIVPLFLLGEFFLTLFLIVYFAPPWNFLFVCIVPVAIFVIFVRVQLERFINAWNTLVGGTPKEWNIEKLMQSYASAIKRKMEKDE